VDSGAHKHDSRVKLAWVGLVILLLLMDTTQTMAQSDRQQWTLVNCLERALEVSLDVHEALADAQIATSQLAQAKAGRLPQATFTGLLSFTKGAEEGSEAAITGDTTDDIGPWSKGELKIVQPLHTFGRLRNEIRAASQQVAAEQAASEKARDAVLAAIKEFYYSLLFSRQIKDLLDEVHENFTKALETAEERLENQEENITQQDVLKLRIGLAGVSKELLTLERAIAVTHAALKQHLGLSSGMPFDIANTQLKPVELNLQPLTVYLEQASQQRPEIAQIEAGLEARKDRVQASRSAYYPTIFLASCFKSEVAPNRDDTDNPYLKSFNSLDGPGVALGLRWQLDFWMTRAKVAEQLARVTKIEIKKQKAEMGIGLDIQRRYLEMQENQKKLGVARKARKAARALMITSLANFTLGVGEAKEVFNNLGLYSRMASDYYKVIYNFNLTAAKLSQAAGQEITTLSYRR
jgi:outer membrane protein TolC